MIGSPPGRLMRAPLGGDRQLEIDARRDLPGWPAVRRGSLGLHERGVDGLRKRTIHSGEGQQVPARVNDGDALRNLHVRGFRDSGVKELHRALVCQFQRGHRVRHRFVAPSSPKQFYRFYSALKFDSRMTRPN